jgi:pentose-5-phosphate-3-epimerase
VFAATAHVPLLKSSKTNLPCIFKNLEEIHTGCCLCNCTPLGTVVSVLKQNVFVRKALMTVNPKRYAQQKILLVTGGGS